MRLVEKEAIKAKEKLVLSNLRLAANVAGRFTGRGLSLEDLFQEGCLGLLKAADFWDYHKGFRFVTYAHHIVVSFIYRAITISGRTIRLPEDITNLIGKISKAQVFFIVEKGRNPTHEELAAILDVPVKSVKKAMSYIFEPISLYTHVRNDDDESGYTILADIILDDNVTPFDDDLLYSEFKSNIRAAINKLPPKLRNIINLRFGVFGEPCTLQEIGDRLSISCERVRQLESKALSELRKILREDCRVVSLRN